MRRAWPWWARAGLSVAAVLALHWPFAAYYWTLYGLIPAASTPDGNPVYVCGPVGELTGWVTDLTWRYGFGLGEAVLGAVVAVVVYTVLTHRFGRRYDSETRCRRCRHLLHGLAGPRCPACGEPI